jgi:TorA maturation chaperone TorD
MMSPEEEGRASFYGLLARLFAAPPDAALLRSLAEAAPLEAEEGALAAAWLALCRAAAQADAEALREIYEAKFIGTGKAPVTLYASAYLIRYSNDAPLAELRGQLARLGLARRSNVNEPEDHVAALCEVMRHLIAEKETPLEEQRRFFERWIRLTAEPLCAAIEQSDKNGFYTRVAKLFVALCTVEHMSFEML